MSSARERAAQLNEQGLELDRAGRAAEAEAAYRRAIEADPSWAVPHYNLGLLCKYAGRWAESLDASRRALELDASDAAAAWNLGIAATALGEWAIARQAWERCGIELPPGAGPIQADFGPVPIRLDPDGRGEVVWARRIDPARARIVSVPLPESGHRYSDLLLHDGAAVGERRLGERAVPVFNALARLEASGYQTFVLWAPGATPGAIPALEALADEEECGFEDWSANVRYICAQCSRGPAPPGHQHHAPDAERSLQPAVAARSLAAALRLAQRWSEREGIGPVSVRLVSAPGT
jgi:tetratricopeptide (TPR) repeat protein